MVENTLAMASGTSSRTAGDVFAHADDGRTDLEFVHVCKRYGTHPEVIRDVNLSIRQGEFCAFVGPSGCGKSTLLRMVAGLEDISSGELRLGGQRINEKAPTERGVAMVFQSYALYPHMTVYDNMAFGLKIAKSSRATIADKVGEAARILQLEPLLSRLPRQLSGGQRQRVAIGRAIVRQPKLFLMDEPLSNLDAALRVQTRLEIARLHAQLKSSSMIYVTHDQVEAMTLADKIVLLNPGARVAEHGSIAQVGSPLELYHHPVNQFVAGFIGSPAMNFLSARVHALTQEGVRAVLLDGTLVDVALDLARDVAGKAANNSENKVISNVVHNMADLQPGDPVTLGIRPEHLSLSLKGPSASQLRARVSHVEHMGELSYVYADMTGGRLPVVASCPGTFGARVGDPVCFYVMVADVYLFDHFGNAGKRRLI